MRVAERTDIREEGDFQGETVAMTLDENSLAHIMSVLTTLYSDPIAAVIREYSTNAFDSHREAGNDEPFEVVLPSPINPVFTVRDFGVGLSTDGIRKVYSKYGYSTKRHTDEQTGMLGMGCKAALAYTDQFTLVGTQDGVRTTAVISRDASGAGSILIVDVSDTDEPNGVEVQVPVKDTETFKRRAAEFFVFWDSGLVKINGKLNVSIFDEAFPGTDWQGVTIGPDDIIRINENLVVNTRNTRDMVVQGNVAYPVSNSEFNMTSGYQGALYARVDIGSVSFAPSREALTYDKRTKEVLAGIRDYAKRHLWKVTAKKFEAIEDPFEALRWFTANKQYLDPSQTFTFGKDNLPNPVGNHDCGEKGFKYTPHRKQGRSRVSEWNGNYSFGVNGYGSSNDLREVIFVENYTNANFTVPQRNKVLAAVGSDWSSYRSYYNAAIYLCDTIPDTLRVWLEAREAQPTDGQEDIKLILDWNEVNKIKVGKDGARSTGATYTVLDAAGGSDEFELEDIKAYLKSTGQRVVYFSPARDVDPDALMNVLPKGEYVVSLAKNRFKKFLRELDGIKCVRLSEALQEVANATAAALTEADRVALHTDPKFSYTSPLRHWDTLAKHMPDGAEKELLDADLSALLNDMNDLVNRAGRPSKEAKAYRYLSDVLRHMTTGVGLPSSKPLHTVLSDEREELDERAKKLLARYPLQETLYHKRWGKDLLDYYNGVYSLLHTQATDSTDQEKVA